MIGSRLLVLAAAASLGGAPAGEPAVPDGFTRPTPQQVAASIQVWDPTGSVTPIETEATDGDEVVLTLDSDILFAFGSAELPAAAPERLAELVAPIPPGAPVSITGHTDDIGTDADNQVLSDERAAAVAGAVAAARPDLVLTVAGRGESEPVASNGDAEGRERNRRVEIRFAA